MAGNGGLYYALCHHGLGDFHEAGNIGALDVVDVAIGLCAVVAALLVDVLHYLMESLIDFFLAPLYSH